MRRARTRRRRSGIGRRAGACVMIQTRRAVARQPRAAAAESSTVQRGRRDGASERMLADADAGAGAGAGARAAIVANAADEARTTVGARVQSWSTRKESGSKRSKGMHGDAPKNSVPEQRALASDESSSAGRRGAKRHTEPTAIAVAESDFDDASVAAKKAGLEKGSVSRAHAGMEEGTHTKAMSNLQQSHDAHHAEHVHIASTKAQRTSAKSEQEELEKPCDAGDSRLAHVPPRPTLTRSACKKIRIRSECLWSPADISAKVLRRFLLHCQAACQELSSGLMRPADELAALGAFFRRHTVRAHIHHPWHTTRASREPQSESPESLGCGAAAPQKDVNAGAMNGVEKDRREDQRAAHSAGAENCAFCVELDARFALSDYMLRLRAQQQARLEASEEGLCSREALEIDDLSILHVTTSKKRRVAGCERTEGGPWESIERYSSIVGNDEQILCAKPSLLCATQALESVRYRGHADKVVVERDSDVRWTPTEELNFEHGLLRYGKCFWKMQRALFPQRETRELVNYYFVRYKQGWMQSGGERCPRGLLHFQNFAPPVPVVIGTWPAVPSASAVVPLGSASGATFGGTGGAGGALPSPTAAARRFGSSGAASPQADARVDKLSAVISGCATSYAATMTFDSRRISERSAKYARSLLEQLAKRPLSRFPPEQGMSAMVRGARERRALLMHRQIIARLPPSSSTGNLSLAAELLGNGQAHAARSPMQSPQSNAQRKTTEQFGCRAHAPTVLTNVASANGDADDDLSKCRGAPKLSEADSQSQSGSNGDREMRHGAPAAANVDAALRNTTNT